MLSRARPELREARIRQSAEQPAQFCSQPDIQFQSAAYLPLAPYDWVQFEVRLNRDQFAWTDEPGGKRRAQTIVAMVSYSGDGERICQHAMHFSIFQDEALLPVTADVPFVHAETISFPKNVARVRVFVGDATSGKVGFHDFSAQEISKAPRTVGGIRQRWLVQFVLICPRSAPPFVLRPT